MQLLFAKAFASNLLIFELFSSDGIENRIHVCKCFAFTLRVNLLGFVRKQIIKSSQVAFAWWKVHLEKIYWLRKTSLREVEEEQEKNRRIICRNKTNIKSNFFEIRVRRWWNLKKRRKRKKKSGRKTKQAGKRLRSQKSLIKGFEREKKTNKN